MKAKDVITKYLEQIYKLKIENAMDAVKAITMCTVIRTALDVKDKQSISFEPDINVTLMHGSESDTKDVINKDTEEAIIKNIYQMIAAEASHGKQTEKGDAGKDEEKKQISDERSCLGRKVKDTVTGFEGEITAYVMYKTGADRVMVEGVDSTGRPVERWSDVMRNTFL